MTIINKHTCVLIADFLDGHYPEFQGFLDGRDIEPTEAEVIIAGLRQIATEED